MAQARWIVAAALFVVACSSPEERLASHLERGEAYLEEGRPDEALLEFQSALNLLPDDANLYERVGRVLYQRGRFDEALRHFVHAQRLDPTRVEAAMFEARIIVRRNPDRAKQLVKAALDEDPDRDVVQRAKSLIALTEGDTVTALKAAQQAAQLNAEEPENWLALGAVYQTRIHDRQQRRRPPKDQVFSSALAAFGRVEKLEPGDPRSVVLQARVYAAWPGHEAEALAAFDRALEVARPTGRSDDVALVADALDDYAKLLKRPELRVRALRELIAVQPANYDAWESLAHQAGAENPLQSEGVYLELLEQNPQDPRAHLIYANYLLRTDRGRDAEGHVRHVLSEEMDEAGLWDWLVRMELRRGRSARARAAYVELSERHKGSFEARSAAVRLALAEGRPEEATRLLVPLIKEAETAELQRLRALAAYRVGNLPAAGTAIAKSIALSAQPSAAALRLRARIGHDAKRWTQVLDSYQRLEGLGTELTGEDQVQLATALYRSGEEERGLAQLQVLLKQTPPVPGAALAYAELRRGPDPEGARQVLLASLAAYPNDADLVAALTRLDVAAGRAQEALERLNAVVSGGGATPSVLQLRAEMLAELGAYDEAEADLLRAFEANPGLPGAIDLLYQIYAAQGRLEEARRSFEQAEEAGVLHPGARLLLARLYLGERRPDRARDMLEQVVADRPELWSARNDLAWVLAELGEDLDRALILARTAQLSSGNLPASFDTLGWVHLKAGRYRASLDEFTRAIRLAEQRAEEPPPAFRYHLGLALEGLGRQEEAARAFEQALAHGEFPEAEDARRRLEAARHPEPDTEQAS